MRKIASSIRDKRDDTWHIAFSHKAHFDNCGTGRKRANLRIRDSDIWFDRNFTFSLSRYTFPWPEGGDKATHRIPGKGIDFLITSNWKERDPHYGGDRDFQFSIPLHYDEAILFAGALLKMAHQIKQELEAGIGWRIPTLEQLEQDIDFPDVEEKGVYKIA